MAKKESTYLLSIPVEELRKMTEMGWGQKRIADHIGEKRDKVRYAQHVAGIQPLARWSQPGERNHFWKGGRIKDKDGYILIFKPDHPHASKKGKGRAGYVREHRLVLEGVLGRYLLPAEVVHHIDGNKENNTPSNLEIFKNNGHHLAQTLKGKRPNWTEDGKRRISEGSSRAWKTRVVSEETRKKQSLAQLRRYGKL